MLSPLRLLVAALGFSSLCCMQVAANVPNAVRSADGSFAVLFGSAGGQGSIKVLKDESAANNQNFTLTDSNENENHSAFHRTFEARFNRIEETDSVTGRTVQSAKGFAKDAAMWQGPTTTELNNITAQLVSLTNDALQIGNGKDATSSASLTISAYIFSVSGYILQGNESLSVPKNALKLTFAINNWPFVSMNNNLTFGLELMLDTRSSASWPRNHDGINIDNGRQRRLDWGGAALDVATSALIDGVLTPIKTDLTQNGAKTFIAFSFPSFNNSVVYDPTVSIDDTATNSAVQIASGASALLLALFATAVASMQL